MIISSSRSLLYSFSAALAALVILFTGAADAATPQVAVGDSATCFLADNGTVSCQGNNDYGGIAQPATLLESSVPLPVAGLTGVEGIEAGDEFFCALLAGGSVACWGQNDGRQAGDGTTEDRFTPGVVPGIVGAVALTGLDDTMCAEFADGSVKCWGRNSGQMGQTHAAVTSTSIPLDIPGFAGSRGASNGDDQLCAIFGSAVRCQGENNYSQSGQPLSVDYVGTPTEVPGTASAVQVSAGEDFTCALIAPGGTVKCWGEGDDGRLGQGPADMLLKESPVELPGLSGIVKIKLGEEHACALRNDGAVLCWGRSSNGQAGQDASYVSPAQQVAIGVPAVDIDVGYDGACALLRGGGVSCWGDNDSGGLGAPTGPVTTPRMMADIDLVTQPHEVQSAGFTLLGKTRLDRKRKNFTRAARLTVTPSSFVLLSDACVGTATATTSYKYKATKIKRVRGKRKRVKVTRTKKLRARGTLTAVDNTCVADFKLKLPVKYFAKKKKTITASVPANAGIQALSVKVSAKLPKVKKKKRK